MSTAASTTRTSGAAAIRNVFTEAAADGRAALMPYVVCGRPSLAEMPALIATLATNGADLIELGIPFSDPLADGDVIRNATRKALDDGVSVAGCLDAVRAIRNAGSTVPLVAMSYVNPLLSYGLERFCTDAAAAGIDGVIIPDVRLEQADELRAYAAASGLGIVFLATPLTSDERIAELAAASSGFLYAVATTGTTGVRDQLASGTVDLLKRARLAANGVPVAVGFGVSTPEHVAALAPYADGVIVGSALVAVIESDVRTLEDAVGELRSGARLNR